MLGNIHKLRLVLNFEDFEPPPPSLTSLLNKLIKSRLYLQDALLPFVCQRSLWMPPHEFFDTKLELMFINWEYYGKFRKMNSP